MRSLQPQINGFVFHREASVKSIGDILDVARLAETAGMLNTTAAQNDMSWSHGGNQGE